MGFSPTPARARHRSGEHVGPSGGDVHAVAEAFTALLVRGGLTFGDGPDDAPASARMLCWMVERSFYQASRISEPELEHEAAGPSADAPSHGTACRESNTSPPPC
ncbi:hypothetical protein BST27_09440 [Mycobacterium intermedium]|uniref:Uncharacterized protein n=1 Tax=Mycobacterium intermedium TaxID=28445 RepID=A0A1E3SH10_MYCIE|nr:hypothetical protein BHQ20_09225 [Mycobacterium intermedium]OPE52549.1 hypothetical protein BV508_01955 [Mycobacterium intermedium]ORB07464.1 hypothetical protein BST27_09440 [Mycobacterium intermedium]